MNYRIETTTHSELSWREIVEIFLVNYSCGSRWADFQRILVKAFHSYHGTCIYCYMYMLSIILLKHYIASYCNGHCEPRSPVMQL